MTNDERIEKILDQLSGIPLGDAVGILEMVKFALMLEAMDEVPEMRFH